ncbi:GNAT family N-acetyltransferase [Pontibacter amylolyticus]|nr:GNAT family N-acetyltransferase [Pontibacter amylolyticus]
MSITYLSTDMLPKAAVVQPSMSLKLTTGEKSLNLLNDPEFLSSWDILYKECPWGTVFQSKEFVASWYRLYCKDFISIMVRAEFDGKLVGLLTLTKNKSSKGIKFAGLDAAEYQTWLATPAMGESFINEALIELQNEYPKDDIRFINIPPQTPLDWVRVNEKWKQHCILESLTRPLMDLSNPAISNVFRKKQFREKTNRLKRLGNVVFEKVTDLERFSSLIDELIVHSEFRKGAKFNFFQFETDPRGKQFLIELFREGILHTTILWLDDKIIASIAAPTGKKWAHLASLNTHSPIYARYSPGLINFIMLGQLLTEEGMHIFDLTPGGDSYKERLATSKDQVHTLRISSAFKTKVKKAIIDPVFKVLKSKLREKGITPRHLKYKGIKFKQRVILLSRLGLKAGSVSFNYLIFGVPKRLGIYEHIMGDPIDYSYSLNVNNIKSLLSYNPQQGLSTRWDFLEDAMKRFESGEHVYSITYSGELVCCVWHNPLINYKGLHKSLKDSTFVLRLVYIHPNHIKQIHNILTSIALATNDKHYLGQSIIFLVEDRNKSLLQYLNISSFISTHKL